jgi:hypothetical protein
MQSELIRVEHSHGNNEWARWKIIHDPAQTDDERQWSRHRIFRCRSCDEEIRVDTPNQVATSEMNGATAGSRRSSWLLLHPYWRAEKTFCACESVRSPAVIIVSPLT